MQTEFMVVSNNRIYMCDTIEKLKNKVSALNTFDISFKVYYKLNDEWVDMLISPSDMLCALNKGLKGV